MKMNTNEVISVYQISKEMFIKEKGSKEEFTLKNPDDDYDKKFENFYHLNLFKIKEILLSLGVNKELFKSIGNNGYSISVDKKDFVIGLLESFTTKRTDPVVCGEFEKMEISNLEKLISQVDEVIKNTFSEDNYEKTMEDIYLFTRKMFIKIKKELQANITTQINDDIEFIKPLFINESKLLKEPDKKQLEYKIAANYEDEWYCLNETDKVYLLKLYEQLIVGTSERWRSIVRLFSDLRETDVMESTRKMIKNEYDEREMEKELLNMVEDTYSMLVKVVLKYDGNRFTEHLKYQEKPSENTMKKVKEIIDKYNSKNKSEAKS